MPLTVVRRPGRAGWWICGTVTPAGAPRGVRVRRRAGSDDERLAREEAAAVEASILRDAWHGPRRAAVGFSAAALSYLTHTPRSAGTRALVRRLVLHWVDTPIDRIDQAAVDRARGMLLRPGASPATVRRNLITPLRAILSHGARRGWCEAPRFDLPAEPPGRTAYLLPGEARRLLECAAPHLRPLLVYLLATGCRLGEALSLEWRQVDLRGRRVLLEATQTKARRARLVELPPAALVALAALPGREGAVFRTPRGTPYRATGSGAGGGHIKTAWHRAAAAAGLPDITPHVLRHTWASWHYALHRDLLLLARAGGWASTALVERYAHLLPSGHEGQIHAMLGTDTTATPLAQPEIKSA